VAWYLGHDDPTSEAARKWVRRQVLERELPEAEREGCAPRFDPEAVATWSERLPVGRWGWRDVARFLGHANPTTEVARKCVAYRIKHHGLPVEGRPSTARSSIRPLSAAGTSAVSHAGGGRDGGELVSTCPARSSGP